MMMTEKFKILAKYIKDMSSETPDVETFLFVKDNISKKRLIIFQKRAQDIKMKYRKSLFNKTAFVLFENKMKLKDAYFGRDEYGNSIIVRSTEDLNGKVKNFLINRNSLERFVLRKKKRILQHKICLK